MQDPQNPTPQQPADDFDALWAKLMAENGRGVEGLGLDKPSGILNMTPPPELQDFGRGIMFKNLTDPKSDAGLGSWGELAGNAVGAVGWPRMLGGGAKLGAMLAGVPKATRAQIPTSLYGVGRGAVDLVKGGVNALKGLLPGERMMQGMQSTQAAPKVGEAAGAMLNFDDVLPSTFGQLNPSALRALITSMQRRGIIKSVNDLAPVVDRNKHLAQILAAGK